MNHTMQVQYWLPRHKPHYTFRLGQCNIERIGNYSHVNLSVRAIGPAQAICQKVPEAPGYLPPNPNAGSPLFSDWCIAKPLRSGQKPVLTPMHLQGRISLLS